MEKPNASAGPALTGAFLYRGADEITLQKRKENVSKNDGTETARALQ